VIPFEDLVNWKCVEIINSASLWLMVWSGWLALSMNALIGVNDGAIRWADPSESEESRALLPFQEPTDPRALFLLLRPGTIRENH